MNFLRTRGLSATPAARCVAAAFAVSQAADAAMVSVNPTADAFVTTGPSNDLSANNYGGAGVLGLAGTSSARGEFQSVIRFDLASAVSAFNAEFGAGQWMIGGATLRLTTAPANNALFNSSTAGIFAIQWIANDAWVEGNGNPAGPSATGISYNTLPSLTSLADASLGLFTFTGAATGNNSWNLGLASGFTADVASAGSVSLRLSAADAAVAYLFNSTSFGTVASRPLLSISASAIPEPGAAILLGGAGLLALTRRRR